MAGPKHPESSAEEMDMIDIQTRSDGDISFCPGSEFGVPATSVLRLLVNKALKSGRDIVIDLRHVGFIEPAGVTALADSVRTVRAVGGRARICNAGSRVQWRLELVGLLPWPGAASCAEPLDSAA
jgi:anti-anti-sigma factor